ncbi:MAG: hypothetical protein IJN51_01180 [Alistipes sp.]|nr:hypothetical protein [Alistipes sp.]
MKAQALDALKAKFVGVSEAILSRIADKIAKTAKTEEEVTTAVEGVTFQQVLESYGDSRATEAQQTAVTNYEKKHGLKDGKKVEDGGGKPNPNPTGGQGGNGGGGNDDLAAQIAAAIAAEMKPFKDELAAMKGEKVATSRKSALDKVLVNAPEKIRQRYEKDFARMTFNDDEDFNAWIGEITPDVEAITSDFNAKGGVVTRPRGGATGGNGGNENPHLKARIAEREAETAAPAIIGLPSGNK